MHSSPGVPAMLMELLRRATTHALHTFKRNKPKVQNREIGKQQQILCVYKSYNHQCTKGKALLHNNNITNTIITRGNAKRIVEVPQ